MPKENQLGQEKTEKPTGKRVREARNEGNVTKSMEANSAAVLLSGMIALMAFGGWMMNRLMTMATTVYYRLEDIALEKSTFQDYLATSVVWVLSTLLPIFLIIAVTGIIINLIQSGFLWSTKSLKPKPDKLNPFKGAKNILNQQAFVRFFFNIVKVIIVGWVGYVIVRNAWTKFVPLMDSSVWLIFLFLVHTVLKLMMWIIAVLGIVAIIDFAYQKYKYIEGLKMSKQDVKDERKMMEGDPQIKQKIRQTQFQIAFNQMIKDLPKADVVVTNPVHVAVALKYDQESMDAPIMLGKGLRKLAARIKEVARENDIPIVENPPLARALYKHCEIGEDIPGQFYQDVAEILAQIYQLEAELNSV